MRSKKQEARSKEKTMCKSLLFHLFVSLPLCFSASLLLCLSASVSIAQAPSLNLPEMPTQPLVIVFKGVTRHAPFRLVMQTLKEGKRAENLVMTRAQKGLIEYRGKFFGDSASLLEQLEVAIEGKLKLESKTTTDGNLEIIVTTEGS